MSSPSAPDITHTREQPTASHPSGEDLPFTRPRDDIEALRVIIDALTQFESKDQERIIRWASEKLGLTTVRAPHLTASQAPQASHTAGQQPAAPPGEVHRVKDIRSFIESKQPQSDNQFAAAVAYYYRFEAPEIERKSDISAADLQDATRKAGRSRLGDPDKTLRNAEGRGYLDKVDRGRFALSTVGENLVAMTLPQGAASQSRGGLNRRSRDSRKK